eukprot:scaffold33600_cov101-Isochrysis_galbana.AAC.1
MAGPTTTLAGSIPTGSSRAYPCVWRWARRIWPIRRSGSYGATQATRRTRRSPSSRRRWAECRG